MGSRKTTWELDGSPGEKRRDGHSLALNVPPVQFSVLCFLITLAAVPIFIFLYLGLLSFLKKQ